VKENSFAERVAMVHHSSQGRFAIREGNWKLVMEDGRRGKRELFDLSKDPGETKNLIAENPVISKRLTAKLTALIRNGRSSPGPVQKNDTPPWRDLVWMK
jgi:arylsulfatase A